MSKCLDCARCVRACRDFQGLGIWTCNDSAVYPISTSNSLNLDETSCVSCGQCVSLCPSGALSERSDFEPIRKAMKEGKVVVAQVAPSVRVSIGEEFGKSPGTISTGQLVMGLKRSGFHYVFDTAISVRKFVCFVNLCFLQADLTIVEEGTEFATRIAKSKPGPFPMFTSCCPGWINLLEKEVCLLSWLLDYLVQYPKLISRVSSCKSPQAMLSALIKVLKFSLSQLTCFSVVVGKKNRSAS